MSNIYEKIQDMRCKMQSTKLKKSGLNKFAGYDYFELEDIIPTINELMKEYKVCSELSFGDYNESATLKIINAEKPEEIMSFSCPVKSATLKGCHEVQNLGASITYIRRYLYINAFEIVEHDALDRMPLNATKKSNILFSTSLTTNHGMNPDKVLISLKEMQPKINVNSVNELPVNTQNWITSNIEKFNGCEV